MSMPDWGLGPSFDYDPPQPILISTNAVFLGGVVKGMLEPVHDMGVEIEENGGQDFTGNKYHPT